jgi:GNAT superfamily N-acetyltransferase
MRVGTSSSDRSITTGRARTSRHLRAATLARSAGRSVTFADMTSAYVVRAARTDDLSVVLGVLAENRPNRPDGWSGQAVSPSDRQCDAWQRVMTSPDVTVYLAQKIGKGVGTACLSILPNVTYDGRPTAFIEAVVVKYEHRRNGVAQMLIRRALDDARRAACFKVQLVTHKRHADDGAHDLYRSIGFVAEAEGFRLYLEDR